MELDGLYEEDDEEYFVGSGGSNIPVTIVTPPLSRPVREKKGSMLHWPSSFKWFENMTTQKNPMFDIVFFFLGIIF